MKRTDGRRSRRGGADLLATTVSRLKRIVEVMPDEASITLPIATIKEWLKEAAVLEPKDQLVDLTVSDVANRLNRSPSTVRGWCGSGALRAYRLRGREWRVPVGALRDFLDAEAGGTRHVDTEDVDIGAWRNL